MEEIPTSSEIVENIESETSHMGNPSEELINQEDVEPDSQSFAETVVNPNITIGEDNDSNMIHASSSSVFISPDSVVADSQQEQEALTIPVPVTTVENIDYHDTSAGEIPTTLDASTIEDPDLFVQHKDVETTQNESTHVTVANTNFSDREHEGQFDFLKVTHENVNKLI